MKFLILSLIAVVCGQENYNGPEYAPIDTSNLIPVQELPGFWEGRNFPPSLTNPKSPRNRRIIGGVEVVPHSYPYQVAVHMTFGQVVGVCGGSVLTVRSALTAAHCLLGSTSSVIIAGAHNRVIIEPTQQRRFVELSGYRIHERYDTVSLNNDIAIAITPEPNFTFNEQVQPTRRPTEAMIRESFIGDLGKVFT